MGERESGKERETDALIISCSEVENPFPGRSLGDIGRAIELRLDERASRIYRPLVSVHYRPEDLGWVDPATLRLFEIDASIGTYDLVRDSWVDTESRSVNAFLDRSGIYVVIGLPGEGPVREVVDELFERLERWGAAEVPRGWHVPTCDRILGARDVAGTPPRGLSQSPHAACIGLDQIPPPELALLADLVPGDVAVPQPETYVPDPPGPYLYALGGWQFSGPGMNVPAGNFFVEIIDPLTWTQVDIVRIGPPTVGYSLAASAGRLAITDWFGSAVLLISGGTRTRVPVGSYPDACCFSRDGSILHVSTHDTLEAIDVVAGTSTVRASRQGGYRSVCISPDGKTVAAGAGPGAWGTGPHVVLLDTVSFALRQVPVPPQAGSNGLTFVSDDLLVTWDSGTYTARQVAVPAGVALPVAISTTPPALMTGGYGGPAPGGRGCYVTRGVIFGSGAATGDLIEVDIAGASATRLCQFSGYPTAPVFDWRTGREIFVTVQEPNKTTLSIAAFDLTTGTLSPHVYSLFNGSPPNAYYSVAGLALR